MLLISGIIIVFIFLLVGGILWAVKSKIDQVTDFKNTLLTPKPTASGKPSFAREILRFGGEGNGAGKFTDNRMIAVDGDGKIYSADYSGGRVQVFDKDGKFLNLWFVEKKEAALNALVASRNGTVYIAQVGKIMAFEGASGKLLNETKTEFVSDLAVAWDGKVIAADRNAILVFDQTLKNIANYQDAAQTAGVSNGFNSLAVNGLGEIFATSRGGKDLIKFSAEGKFSDRFKIKSTSVNDIAIDPKGRIFLAEVSQVLIYQANGDLIDSFQTIQSFGLAFNEQGELLTASRPFVVKYEVNQ